MLNILWVEDNFSPEKQQTWFSGRIPDLKTNFIDALEAIHTDLNQYDLVILDIDLENTPQSEKVTKFANYFGKSEKEFLKESGLFLFLQLIELGFSRDRIIFLTGNADENISRVDELRKAAEKDDDSDFNEIIEKMRKGLHPKMQEKLTPFLADDDIEGLCNYLENYYNSQGKEEEKNTYNRFCDSFKNAFLLPPKEINKGLNVTKRLNEWLETHEKNPYLVLRRGIIDACDFLESSTDDNELKEYFFSLKRYLPLKEPNESDKKNIYLHLARTILHDWDNQGHAIPKGRPDEQLGWLLRTARNWLTHDSLLNQINERMISFIFLINARLLVKLNSNGLENFEKNLLSIFESTNESQAGIVLNLKVFYQDALKKAKNENLDFMKKQYFYSQMVNDFHEKKVSGDYNKFLFRIFMFSIYGQDFSILKNDPNLPFLNYQIKFVKRDNLPAYLIEFEKRFYSLSI